MAGDANLDPVLKLSCRFLHCKVATISLIIKTNLGEVHDDYEDTVFLNFAH